MMTGPTHDRSMRGTFVVTAIATLLALAGLASAETSADVDYDVDPDPPRVAVAVRVTVDGAPPVEQGVSVGG